MPRDFHFLLVIRDRVTCDISLTSFPSFPKWSLYFKEKIEVASRKHNWRSCSPEKKFFFHEMKIIYQQLHLYLLHFLLKWVGVGFHSCYKNAKNAEHSPGVYISFEGVLPSDQKQSKVETPYKATMTREMQSLKWVVGQRPLKICWPRKKAEFRPLGGGSEG